MPRKLELQLKRLADAEACVCHAEFFLDGEPPPGFRPELLRRRGRCGSWRRSPRGARCSTRVGGLRAEVSPADDVDWFARVQDAGIEVAVLPQTLLRKRVHAGSTAHTQPAPLTELLRASIERRRIAVVVPVHDGERYLEPALRSLLEQTRPPDELIVVDNGSRDGSAAHRRGARRARAAARRTWARRSRGTSASRAARAGLIGFLDADDLAMPRRLELQAAALGPGVDAVIGQVENFAEPGAEHYGFAAGVRAGYNPGALLIRREAFEALGGFDESLGARRGRRLLRAAARPAAADARRGRAAPAHPRREQHAAATRPCTPATSRRRGERSRGGAHDRRRARPAAARDARA